MHSDYNFSPIYFYYSGLLILSYIRGTKNDF